MCPSTMRDKQGWTIYLPHETPGRQQNTCYNGGESQNCSEGKKLEANQTALFYLNEISQRGKRRGSLVYSWNPTSSISLPHEYKQCILGNILVIEPDFTKPTWAHVFATSQSSILTQIPHRPPPCPRLLHKWSWCPDSGLPWDSKSAWFCSSLRVDNVWF